MTIFGYTEIDGQPVEVTSLKRKESFLIARRRRLERIIDRAEKAKVTITEMVSTCPHRIFKDTPGLPYDLRHCIVCGAFIGRI